MPGSPGPSRGLMHQDAGLEEKSGEKSHSQRGTPARKSSGGLFHLHAPKLFSKKSSSDKLVKSTHISTSATHSRQNSDDAVPAKALETLPSSEERIPPVAAAPSVAAEVPIGAAGEPKTIAGPSITSPPKERTPAVVGEPAMTPVGAAPGASAATPMIALGRQSSTVQPAAGGSSFKLPNGPVARAVKWSWSYLEPVFSDRRAGALGKGAARSPLDAAAALRPDQYPGARDLNNRADVAIVGLQGEREVVLQSLRQRGFVVRHAVDSPDGETMMVALALGPKLMAKLSIEEDIPRKKPEEYTLPERGRLAKQAVAVLSRSGLVYADALLLHDPYAIKAVGASMHPDAIACYFGSGIGLYFAWLRHYTQSLALPGAAGVILYITQLSGGVDTPLVPAFCILMALWTTLYMLSWRRKEAATAFGWQVLDVEDEEEKAMLAEQVDKPKQSAASRYLVTVPINIVAIMIVVRAMLYCQYITDHTSELYGADSWWVYWPTLVYAVVPPVCSTVYGTLSQALNTFEKHSTKTRAVNNLIMKRFAFEVVNSYCALFYIGFYMRDINRLRSMLFSLMTIKQVMGNVIEVVLPIVTIKVKDYLAKRAAHKAEEAAVKAEAEIAAKERAADDAAAAATAVLGSKAAEKEPLLGGSAPEDSKEEAPASVTTGTGSLLGKISSPPRVGLKKMISSKSPLKAGSKPGSKASSPAKPVSAAVALPPAEKKAALQAVAAAGAAVGAAIAQKPTGVPGMQRVKSSLSKLTEESFLQELQEAEVDIGDEYMEMIIQFGYCTMFAVVFPLAPLMALINNTAEYHIDLSKLLSGRRPPAVQAATIGSWALCLEILGHVATITNCVIMALMSDNMGSYIPTAWEGLLATTEGRVLLAVIFEHILLFAKSVLVTAMDPKPIWVKARQAKIEIERAEQNKKYRLMAHNMQVAKRVVDHAEIERAKTIADLQTIRTTHDAWAFGPWIAGPLVALPYVVAATGLSAWTMFPVAAAIVGYMQHQKAKADIGVALGIVTDANVLRLIGTELPSWFSDGEFERVEFLNKLLHKMWRPTTLAIKQMVLDTVQPILNQYRPPGITALGFRRVSLGTVPPKIVAVRVLDVSNSRATLDVEMKWASDAVIVLEAGVKPLPLVLELNKIRFSGKCRIELDPLVPIIPMFGALSITFMEKPLLDFSFKVAKLDIMSIGPGDMSIGKAISNMIRTIISDMLVFPHKLVIPIMEDVDLKAVANTPPAGILQVHVAKAESLRAADSNGASDPFVTVLVGTETVKTTIVPKELNPVWDQDFDFMIHDPGQAVRFEVYDSDKGVLASDDSLGECEVRIQSLHPSVPTPLRLVLQDTTTGVLDVVLNYTPLQQPAGADEEEVDQDLIFTLDGGALTDDIVSKDAFLSEAVGDGEIPDGPIEIGVGTVKSKPPPSIEEKVSVGVLTVKDMTVKDVKAGNGCYLLVQQGGTTRTTIVEKQATSDFPEVFHFLVHGAEGASLKVSLMTKASMLNPTKMLSKDKCRGVVSVPLGDVLSADNELEDEWHFSAEDAMHGSVSMKLVYYAAAAALS